jgi:hypothetical protein
VNYLKFKYFRVKKIIALCLFILLISGSRAQQKIVLNYEGKPNSANWWRDNNHVKFLLDEKKENQLNSNSKVCLNVQWDSIPSNKSWCWFTDLKIDSLANPVMDKVRAEFSDKIWLSCWCNSGQGDSVYVQPLMLTRGHKGKWGAKKMVGIGSSKWFFLKFKLANLEYENWGKIPGLPNLKTDEIRCFEFGLRNGKTSPKGFIYARFDDVMITNYEPFPNKTKK